MTDFIALPSDAPEEKVSKLLTEIAEDNGKIDSIKKQIEKLQKRIATSNRRIAERRAAISAWMTANDQQTLRLDLATITMSKTKPSVVITDKDKIPVDCFRQETRTVLDKELVKAQLLTGAKMDGAHMSNAAPDLRIRF